MKLKHFFYGFIAGGLAAGISTMLTAPNSGDVTRARIKKKKQLVLNQLRELKTNLIQIKDSATVATKEGKMNILTFLSEVKISLTQWEKEICPQQQAIQKELVEMKETVQELEREFSEYSE
ncbi:YtxH domain-containing protein [Neobacillus drentensis]|uniref:YtxH domain-containing protein n=1 Tax=Neobacillus drentensis TaxID=220684 RepID=UPI003000433A